MEHSQPEKNSKRKAEPSWHKPGQESKQSPGQRFNQKSDPRRPDEIWGKSDEPSVWSTGLVFATLILLTALMFLLARKIVTETSPGAEAPIDIRAKR